MRLSNVSLRFVALLGRPGWVLAGCLLFFTVHLLVQGTIWKIVGLNNEIKRMNIEIQSLNVQLSALDQQLVRAKDPAFLERKAMDQLDMASSEDLLFTFSDEDMASL